MQIAACTPLYSIGTRRTAFTTHFQIIFQKTKKLLSSSSEEEALSLVRNNRANKKADESNRRNYPVRIEHKNVHVKSGFVRRLVAQS